MMRLFSTLPMLGLFDAMLAHPGLKSNPTSVQLRVYILLIDFSRVEEVNIAWTEKDRQQVVIPSPML